MRLFVALELSPEIKEALLSAIADLKAQGASGNFTRRENLHLTLAFIGETDRVAAARSCLEKLDLPAFSMSVAESGSFGELWWVGIERNNSLSKLAASVREGLSAAGFDIDKKPFRPHITVARQLSCPTRPSLSVPKMSMRVGEVLLMRSDRVNGRLTYTTVARKALSAE